MKINRPFVLRDKPTPEIVDLLESVTLGTNGARYRHLDTADRIKHLYNPLFLSLEGKSKVLGNVTFCRRDVGWYVRYFAFSNKMQSESASSTKKSTDGYLKKSLYNFFKSVLEEGETNLFYAYIDRRNERSSWVSKNFGFETVAKIVTQTYSRINPKRKECVKEITDKTELEEVKNKIKALYGDYNLYFTLHTFDDNPFYGLYENGEIKAFVKTHKANWKVERLGGKMGGIMTAVAPFIPSVKKLFNPSQHGFLAVEAVWVNENNPETLNTLLEGVLYNENANSLIWWVDKKDNAYTEYKDKVTWGLFNKLNGANEVDLVMLSKNHSDNIKSDKPFYTTAFDFI